MRVTLIEYTGARDPNPAQYAAALLVFTKNTRLKMSAGGLKTYLDMPMEQLRPELEYMANTIPSSWEMIDYTFMIEEVTRAFTHQFVRTRTASFAQQTMRVLNVSETEDGGPGWTFGTGPTIAAHEDRNMLYSEGMVVIDGLYRSLINHGAAIEDARGVLPTNIHTNIVAKMNMRTFVEMVRKRSSSRTQGEYRDVLEAMKAEVRLVHPWISLFIDRTFDKAANELDEGLRALDIPAEERTRLIKLIDQMRAQS